MMVRICWTRRFCLLNLCIWLSKHKMFWTHANKFLPVIKKDPNEETSGFHRSSYSHMCYLIYQKCEKLLLLSEFDKKNAHNSIFCAINVQKNAHKLQWDWGSRYRSTFLKLHNKNLKVVHSFLSSLQYCCFVVSWSTTIFRSEAKDLPTIAVIELTVSKL